jgi:hypothetical protein
MRQIRDGNDASVGGRLRTATPVMEGQIPHIFPQTRSDRCAERGSHTFGLVPVGGARQEGVGRSKTGSALKLFEMRL